MTVIVLSTSGAHTWTVPMDWDSTNNSIVCLGAGGDSVAANSGNVTGGSGGGGAQYSIRSNMTLTPGDVINIHVGAHGTQPGVSPSSTGSADTWFNTGGTLYAQGGENAYTTGLLGGAGGSWTGPGQLWSQFPGGSGASGNAFVGSTGGGAAGGPNGAGANGGTTGIHPFTDGGSGGGGANGGSVGGSTDGTAPGGDGGNNRLGAGGGLGSTSGGAPGAVGVNGGGGGGGYGSGGGTAGGDGGQDTLWAGAYGPGGGGGGAGYNAGNGGNGGGRGGGGGGAARGYTPGVGTDGLIVITYRGTGSADGKGRLYTRYSRPQLGVAA